MTANLSGVTWSDYVRRTIGPDQQVEAAKKTGLDQTTISRWIRGGQAGRAENVARFARGYHQSVPEAFVVAGFLTPEDLDVQVTITRMEDPSDEQLLELLRKRLERDQTKEVGSREDSAAMYPAGGSPAYTLAVLQDGPTLSDVPDGPPLTDTYEGPPLTDVDDLTLAARAGVSRGQRLRAEQDRHHDGPDPAGPEMGA